MKIYTKNSKIISPKVGDETNQSNSVNTENERISNSNVKSDSFLSKIGVVNIIIMLLTTITACFVAYALITPFSPHKQLYYGVVDPENRFKDSKLVTIEHKFISWDAEQNLTFVNTLDSIINSKRQPMITIEPWSLVKDKPFDFKDFESEVYKKSIKTICQSVESRKKKVILRWGHEMEQTGSRYPWANGDAEGFKTAYKSWVNSCRAETKLVDFMWSPAGREGLEKYYPGPEYVDLIGLSTYGYPEYEEKALGKKYNFEDHFNSRYGRVANYGKDVYLSEFGVAGSPQYQDAWLKRTKELVLDPFKYPNLRAVIYFEYYDKEPWIPGINAPDFRITTNNFPFIQ